MNDLVNDRGYVLAGEWTLSGCHFIKHNSETKEISAPIKFESFDLLRRHVVRRAQDLTAMGHAAGGF